MAAFVRRHGQSSQTVAAKNAFRETNLLALRIVVIRQLSGDLLDFDFVQAVGIKNVTRGARTGHPGTARDLTVFTICTFDLELSPDRKGERRQNQNHGRIKKERKHLAPDCYLSNPPGSEGRPRK